MKIHRGKQFTLIFVLPYLKKFYGCKVVAWEPRKEEIGEYVAEVRILRQLASRSSISARRKSDGSISAPDEELLTVREPLR
jgi:hypothetical protein